MPRVRGRARRGNAAVDGARGERKRMLMVMDAKRRDERQVRWSGFRRRGVAAAGSEAREGRDFVVRWGEMEEMEGDGGRWSARRETGEGGSREEGEVARM